MYTIAERSKVLNDDFIAAHLLVHDGNSEPDIQAYFDRALAAFRERLEVFARADVFDEAEEKKMRFMLEALFAAKFLLTTDKK